MRLEILYLAGNYLPERAPFCQFKAGQAFYPSGRTRNSDRKLNTLQGAKDVCIVPRYISEAYHSLLGARNTALLELLAVSGVGICA